MQSHARPWPWWSYDVSAESIGCWCWCCCCCLVCLPAGLPFRASCCWNGLAVLKAAPFKAGVRIRPPMKGECQVGRGQPEDTLCWGLRSVCVCVLVVVVVVGSDACLRQVTSANVRASLVVYVNSQSTQLH
jgi:hypothetical protein